MMCMWRTVSVFVVCVAAFGQTAVFEAASIKLGDPASPETSTHWSAGMVRIKGMTLKGLIVSAYEVREYQVAGGPKWLDGDRYDITAKLERVEGQSDTPANWRERQLRMHAALRAFLAERFQLAFHEEAKLGPGYALVVAKSGFKLKPMEGAPGMSASSGPGRMTVKGGAMESLATSLSAELRMPVVNETAVPGVYEFKLEYAPEGSAEASSPDKPMRPSLFTALQETLGLKLESRKVSVKLLVIDKAEKPEIN
jgi:bla regulator protein blaR1